MEATPSFAIFFISVSIGAASAACAVAALLAAFAVFAGLLAVVLPAPGSHAARNAAAATSVIIMINLRIHFPHIEKDARREQFKPLPHLFDSRPPVNWEYLICRLNPDVI